MAVCPVQAINIETLDYESDLFPLPAIGPDQAEFINLLDTRRSIRSFSDKAVEKEVLEQIVDQISKAPMGFPPHTTCLTVVHDREKINQAIPLIIELYGKLIRMMQNSLIRYFIKRQIPADKFYSLKDHVMPSLPRRISDMQKGQGDSITRGAPVFVFFHADKTASGYIENAHIALTYGLLAAHAAGLGALANGLVAQAVEKSEKLRVLFNIPGEHEIVTCMVLGYPKHKYPKGIKRQLAGVNWI
jgi:nitroreductase